MKCRFLTRLADAIGKKELEIILQEDHVSLMNVLEMLSAELGLRSEAIIVGCDLAEDVYLLVNGRHISSLQGLKTLVCNDDTLFFIPLTEAG